MKKKGKTKNHIFLCYWHIKILLWVKSKRRIRSVYICMCFYEVRISFYKHIKEDDVSVQSLIMKVFMWIALGF
jgi:hypothetical protein